MMKEQNVHGLAGKEAETPVVLLVPGDCAAAAILSSCSNTRAVLWMPGQRVAVAPLSWRYQWHRTTSRYLTIPWLGVHITIHWVSLSSIHITIHNSGASPDNWHCWDTASITGALASFSWVSLSPDSSNSMQHSLNRTLTILPWKWKSVDMLAGGRLWK